jgi:hypothetical protein
VNTPTIEQGMKALENATPEQIQQALAGGDFRGGFQGPAGGGEGAIRVQGVNAVAGSIVSADADSITVKTAEGGTKIVLVSASSTISKTLPGSMTDLVAGEYVIATGTFNTDGTMTASRVQVGEGLSASRSGDGAGMGPGTSTGAVPSSAGGTPESAGDMPDSTGTTVPD